MQKKILIKGIIRFLERKECATFGEKEKEREKRQERRRKHRGRVRWREFDMQYSITL